MTVPVHLITRIQVPHPDRGVLTSRHDGGTVWIHTQNSDGSSVSYKHHLQVPLIVPHFNYKETAIMWKNSMPTLARITAENRRVLFIFSIMIYL
jgi:hypothetical protein